jgi:pyruvate/2-oxoglutarate dehydrogenase complex dihydrolipoamide acyltransferase (E2) component
MQFLLPDLGEGIVDAELVEWRVRPGDVVEHGQTVLEIMTDKATVEIPSSFAGKIARLLVEPGEQVKIHAPLLEYEGTGKKQTPGREAVPDRSSKSTTSAAQNSQETTPDPSPMPTAGMRGNGRARQATQEVKAAPSVRRMARQLGIDLNQVQGSGPGHRVLIDDLASFVKQTEAEAASAAVPATPELPAHNDYRPGTRIQLRQNG